MMNFFGTGIGGRPRSMGTGKPGLSHLLTLAFFLAPITASMAPMTATLAPQAHAAPTPSYTLDNDPIRLGNRQLEAGEWDAAAAQFKAAVEAAYRLDEAHFGLGLTALRQGRYEDAEEHFQDALKARGGAWAEPRAELGLLLLRRGEATQAADAFDEAAAADPKCWAARYGQALLLLQAGDWEKGRDLLETAKDRKGVLKGEDRYHHAKALMFLANGAIAQAEIEALRAQNLDPVDPRYTALVARVYQEQGHDELAVNAWEQMLAMPGVSPRADTLLELGRLYAKVGRPNDARQKFEEAGAADSTFTPALRELAELYRRAKKPELAARTWLRYAQVAPQDIEAHLGLASAMKELGRNDDAAAAAAKALELKPGHSVATLTYLQAGLRARDQALRDRAGAAAELATAAGTPDGWLLDDQFALAEWQQSQKREQDALVTLQRAAQMDTTSSSVPFQMGLLEMKAGRTAEAAAHFGNAISRDPNQAAAHLNLGIARYQGGNPRAAIGDFRRAVAINGDQVTARLLLAQALAAVDSLKSAEAEYREVLVREAGNAKAQRGIGFCRLRAGDYAAAAEAYESSTQTEPDNADGWAGLGSARLGQSRLDAAGAAFNKARAIDPNNAMLKTGSELLNQARNAGKD